MFLKILMDRGDIWIKFLYLLNNYRIRKNKIYSTNLWGANDINTSLFRIFCFLEPLDWLLLKILDCFVLF